MSRTDKDAVSIATSPNSPNSLFFSLSLLSFFEAFHWHFQWFSSCTTSFAGHTSFLCVACVLSLQLADTVAWYFYKFLWFGWCGSNVVLSWLLDHYAGPQFAFSWQWFMPPRRFNPPLALFPQNLSKHIGLERANKKGRPVRKRTRVYLRWSIVGLVPCPSVSGRSHVLYL